MSLSRGTYDRPAATDGASRGLANGLFACCDCGAELEEFARCTACGRTFALRDGRPALFPEQPRDAVWRIPVAAFDPGAIPRDRTYRYPDRSGQEASGVYHLDRAHEDVLNGLPKGSLVLEIGCGGGQMRKWVKDRGLDYLGTDVSVERVHDWLAQHGGPDILCDAHALPIRSNSVDAVYAVAVWEHLAFPQLAAQEVRRVLKPGGYFLGSASFLEPWHDESYYHMTPNGTHMTLQLAGLDVLFIWPEVNWPGFRAMLVMGNKATRPLAWLGRLMNRFYLFPKQVQFFLGNRRWPGLDDLHTVRSTMAGAIAWIARKSAPAHGSEASA